MACISLFGNTYDVKKFLANHPGGQEVMSPYFGKDASHVFVAFHSKDAYSVLRTLPKVTVARTTEKTRMRSFDTDVHTLRGTFVSKGYFISSIWFYLRKCMELHMLLGASIALLVYNRPWLSSTILGLFFQQAGWLSHDCLHQSVFVSRRLNYWIGGLYIGALLQGLSPKWWMDKHARHHALPNGYMEDEKTGRIVSYDEDIDTVPVILWAPHLTHKMPSSKMLPYQHMYVVPVLMMSKFWWNGRSLVLAGNQHSWVEFCILCMHVFLFVQFGGIWWYFRGIAVGGFLLSFVFIQSHNTKPSHKNNLRGFYATQVCATRNLSLDALTTWFTGGLNYQIEHHLFPRMPRHRYSLVQPLVENACRVHGFKYEVLSIWASWQSLVQHLYVLGNHHHHSDL
jgi:fatty acid desaturase